MNAVQLGEAAVRLEEAFVPAVKRLRGRVSVEVVLDSLFEGADDAGDFVVRFEVTITRYVQYYWHHRWLPLVFVLLYDTIRSVRF